MAITSVITVEGSSVSAGNSDTLKESDNDSWVVETIQVVDESGNLGAVSDVTIKVSGNSVTDQVVPLDSLVGDIPDIPTWNFVWQSNRDLEFSYTNESGSSITLDFVLFVREATESEVNEPPGTMVGSR